MVVFELTLAIIGGITLVVVIFFIALFVFQLKKILTHLQEMKTYLGYRKKLKSHAAMKKF